MQPKYSQVDMEEDLDDYGDHNPAPGHAMPLDTSKSGNRLLKSVSTASSGREYQPVDDCDTTDCEQENNTEMPETQRQPEQTETDDLDYHLQHGLTPHYPTSPPPPPQKKNVFLEKSGYEEEK